MSITFTVSYHEEYHSHPKGYCGSYGVKGDFLTFADAVEYVRKNFSKKILQTWTTNAYCTIEIRGFSTSTPLYYFNIQRGEEVFADNDTAKNLFQMVETVHKKHVEF